MERYHPRRALNKILSEDEKLALLRWGNHVTMALCADYDPYVVTLSYGLDWENRRLYFHCANKGDKLAFIRKNGRACATLVKDDGRLTEARYGIRHR